MKARRDGQEGYRCDNCETIFYRLDWKSETMWRYDSYDTEGCDCCGDVLITKEPQQVKVWRCDNGCLHCEEDEPDIDDIWVCGECGDKYVEREAAGDCCQ